MKINNDIANVRGSVDDEPVLVWMKNFMYPSCLTDAVMNPSTLLMKIGPIEF